MFCRRYPFNAYFLEIAEGIWGCNIPDALAGSPERLNIMMIDGGQRTADASLPHSDMTVITAERVLQPDRVRSCFSKEASSLSVL